MLQSKNAIGNLISRYKSVLKSCHLINTFGSLALAGVVVVASAGMAHAANVVVPKDQTKAITTAQGNNTFEVRNGAALVVKGDGKINTPITITTGSGSVTVKQTGVINDTVTTQSGDVTVDGVDSFIRGKVKTNSGDVFVTNGGTVTNAITTGTGAVTVSGDSTIGGNIWAGGAVDISGGTFAADKTISGASVDITGGTFTANAVSTTAGNAIIDSADQTFKAVSATEGNIEIKNGASVSDGLNATAVFTPDSVNPLITVMTEGTITVDTTGAIGGDVIADGAITITKATASTAIGEVKSEYDSVKIEAKSLADDATITSVSAKDDAKILDGKIGTVTTTDGDISIGAHAEATTVNAGHNATIAGDATTVNAVNNAIINGTAENVTADNSVNIFGTATGTVSAGAEAVIEGIAEGKVSANNIYVADDKGRAEGTGSALGGLEASTITTIDPLTGESITTGGKVTVNTSGKIGTFTDAQGVEVAIATDGAVDIKNGTFDTGGKISGASVDIDGGTFDENVVVSTVGDVTIEKAKVGPSGMGNAFASVDAAGNAIVNDGQVLGQVKAVNNVTIGSDSSADSVDAGGLATIEASVYGNVEGADVVVTNRGAVGTRDVNNDIVNTINATTGNITIDSSNSNIYANLLADKGDIDITGGEFYGNTVKAGDKVIIKDADITTPDISGSFGKIEATNGIVINTTAEFTDNVITKNGVVDIDAGEFANGTIIKGGGVNISGGDFENNVVTATAGRVFIEDADPTNREITGSFGAVNAKIDVTIDTEAEFTGNITARTGVVDIDAGEFAAGTTIKGTSVDISCGTFDGNNITATAGDVTLADDGPGDATPISGSFGSVSATGNVDIGKNDGSGGLLGTIGGGTVGAITAGGDVNVSDGTLLGDVNAGGKVTLEEGCIIGDFANNAAVGITAKDDIVISAAAGLGAGDESAIGAITSETGKVEIKKLGNGSTIESITAAKDVTFSDSDEFRASTVSGKITGSNVFLATGSNYEDKIFVSANGGIKAIGTANTTVIDGVPTTTITGGNVVVNTDGTIGTFTEQRDGQDVDFAIRADGAVDIKNGTFDADGEISGASVDISGGTFDENVLKATGGDVNILNGSGSFGKITAKDGVTISTDAALLGSVKSRKDSIEIIKAGTSELGAVTANEGSVTITDIGDGSMGAVTADGAINILDGTVRGDVISYSGLIDISGTGSILGGLDAGDTITVNIDGAIKKGGIITAENAINITTGGKSKLGDVTSNAGSVTITELGAKSTIESVKAKTGATVNSGLVTGNVEGASVDITGTASVGDGTGIDTITTTISSLTDTGDITINTDGTINAGIDAAGTANIDKGTFANATTIEGAIVDIDGGTFAVNKIKATGGAVSIDDANLATTPDISGSFGKIEATSGVTINTAAKLLGDVTTTNGDILITKAGKSTLGAVSSEFGKVTITDIGNGSMGAVTADGAINIDNGTVRGDVTSHSGLIDISGTGSILGSLDADDTITVDIEGAIKNISTITAGNDINITTDGKSIIGAVISQKGAVTITELGGGSTIESVEAAKKVTINSGTVENGITSHDGAIIVDTTGTTTGTINGAINGAIDAEKDIKIATDGKSIIGAVSSEFGKVTITELGDKSTIASVTADGAIKILDGSILGGLDSGDTITVKTDGAIKNAGGTIIAENAINIIKAGANTKLGDVTSNAGGVTIKNIGDGSMGAVSAGGAIDIRNGSILGGLDSGDTITVKTDGAIKNAGGTIIAEKDINITKAGTSKLGVVESNTGGVTIGKLGADSTIKSVTADTDIAINSGTVNKGITSREGAITVDTTGAINGAIDAKKAIEITAKGLSTIDAVTSQKGSVTITKLGAGSEIASIEAAKKVTINSGTVNGDITSHDGAIIVDTNGAINGSGAISAENDIKIIKAGMSTIGAVSSEFGKVTITKLGANSTIESVKAEQGATIKSGTVNGDVTGSIVKIVDKASVGDDHTTDIITATSGDITINTIGTINADSIAKQGNIDIDNTDITGDITAEQGNIAITDGKVISDSIKADNGYIDITGGAKTTTGALTLGGNLTVADTGTKLTVTTDVTEITGSELKVKNGAVAKFDGGLDFADGGLKVNNATLKAKKTTITNAKVNVIDSTVTMGALTATDSRFFIDPSYMQVASLTDSGSNKFYVSDGSTLEVGTTGVAYDSGISAVAVATDKPVTLAATSKLIVDSDVNANGTFGINDDDLKTHAKLAGNDTVSAYFGDGASFIVGINGPTSDTALTIEGPDKSIVVLDRNAKVVVAGTNTLKTGDQVTLLNNVGTGDTIVYTHDVGLTDFDRVNDLKLTSSTGGTLEFTNQVGGDSTNFGVAPELFDTMQDIWADKKNSISHADHGVRFISQVASTGFVPSDEEAAQILDSTSHASLAAGVAGMGLDTANMVASALDRRLANVRSNTQQDVVAQNGTSTMIASADAQVPYVDPYNVGFGVWATPLYQQSDVDGMRAGGLEGGYDSKIAGALIGADISNESFRCGVAFSLGAGDADSQGDFLNTSNDVDFWGMNVYSGYNYKSFGAKLSAGFTKLTNDIKQDVGAGFGNLTADVDANIYTVGLVLDYTLDLGSNINLIPHVGARYTSVQQDEYTSKLAGNDLFTVDKTTMNSITIPVGVTVTGDFTAGSWTLAPRLDLSYIAAIEDREIENDITVGLTGYKTNGMNAEVLDESTFAGSLGLELGKGNLTIGLDYDIEASENRLSHAVFGTLRYDF